jgi:ADP-ribosylglycohydrolase
LLIGVVWYQHLEAEHVEEFKRHIKRDASMQSLLSLELDEGSKIGYTFKCVGSGFWALCASNDFKHMINLLVREGGDADTYANSGTHARSLALPS